MSHDMFLSPEDKTDSDRALLDGSVDGSHGEADGKRANVIKHRGLEMLIPVAGVFCALCEVFLPDKDVAESDHCSSDAHCKAYEVNCGAILGLDVDQLLFDDRRGGVTYCGQHSTDYN